MNAADPSRILLTTDFSESSALARPLAIGLARRHGAELVLLHVITPPYTDLDAPHGALPGTIQEILDQEARKQLDQLQLPGAEGVKVRRESVVAPTAAAGIIDFAKENGADLIVMSTHGRRVLAQLILGSVARRVLAGAPCPVLCVKRAPEKRSETRMPEERAGTRAAEPAAEGASEKAVEETSERARATRDTGLRISSILVPVDLSDSSRAALELGIEYAADYQAAIHVLYVVQFAIPPVLFDPPILELDEGSHTRISDRLDSFVQEANSRGVDATVTVDQGAPAERIARYADAHDIDLIVLNRKGFGKTPHFLGGVAERLLHEAHTPMLVI